MTSLSNALEYTYLLDTNWGMPKNIVVVGAGGTGGYVIPHLARQVSLQNKLRAIEGHYPHTLTIIEADEVELKNLTRQNFIERDIDKNKGQVMAERYGAAFGITINYVPEYVQTREQLNTIIGQVQSTAGGMAMMTVIVDCVDNNKTRMILEDTARYIADQRGKDVFLLSSGNEEWAGQVVCSHLPRRSTREEWKVRHVSKNRPQQFRTPLLTEIYPEVRKAEDKLPTELSCAERAESAPQQILTNMVAANLLFTFLNTILTAKTHEGEGLQHFAVNFDAQHSVFRTIFNKASEIQKYVR